MNLFNNIYRNRRVLVTGHTGFKGSWLTLWLKHLGAEVAGFSLGTPSSPANFDLLELGNQVHHSLGDIRNQSKLVDVIEGFRPEMVFHLAAQALVRSSYDDPVGTFETNTMGMVNLLECIRTRPWIKVCVLITSDKAYRNDEWCWGYRETDALGGRDPYGASKSCAEIVASSYFYSFLRDGDTRMVTTRAGNVIGGGDWAADRIVPDCIRAWSREESVSVRNPQSTRPWQHVLEPLSGYLWLGAHLWQKGELNGEAFNFGPDPSVNQTVAELLEVMVSRWPGAQWRAAEGIQKKKPEATLLKLSCDKVAFHLQWRPVLEFLETVSMTVDWYHNWHKGEMNLHNYTLGQINQYCSLAKERRLPWVRL